MTIFLLKSLLSVLMLVPAAYAVLAIAPIFGRGADTAAAAAGKRHHRIAGYAVIILFLAVSWLCISFAVAARSEPLPRAALHILLAFGIAALFLIKVAILHRHRQYYEQAKVLGVAIAVLLFMLVGISAGYFLAVSRFGQDRTLDRSAGYAIRGPLLRVVRTASQGAAEIRTDRWSIEHGRKLFQALCASCHDASSTLTIVGPGLKGLLRGKTLPKSGHPATAESIRFQLKQPLGKMPSFAYLSNDEVEDLVAYLNTL